ncbi:hypothetical protein SESBI_33610 [Sesbania bispinosa]|nr:hypothetical protein SESBI_33610 [Sesbania bispinosa]
MIAMMMVADTVAVTAAKGLGVLRGDQFSIADSGVDQIWAMVQPYDAVAPPPVKPSTYRVRRRTLLRKKQRTKRRLSGDDSGNEGFFFGDGGDDWDGHNWDEPSSSLPDPAFDFVYQVLSWIMLSNCLHFAVKKIVRIVADGSIVDSEREKVPSRLAPIC